MPRLTTTIKPISATQFSGYALLWGMPNPAGLIFNQKTAIGDPNRMIGMTIAHGYWAKSGLNDNPTFLSADVGIITAARRTKFGLFVQGKLAPSPSADQRLLTLLRRFAAQGQLAITPDTLAIAKQWLQPDNTLSDFPIVRFSIYVAKPETTGITAGTTSSEPPPADSDSLHPHDSA